MEIITYNQKINMTKISQTKKHETKKVFKNTINLILCEPSSAWHGAKACVINVTSEAPLDKTYPVSMGITCQ